jgi:hypothetical protein
MKKQKILLTAIFLFTIIPFSDLKPDDVNLKNFIIWSHSDIQPKNNDHLTNFPVAVNDIAANFDYIDIAITAGDIVEKKNSSDLYISYLETRKKVKTGGWFVIAGIMNAKI